MFISYFMCFLAIVACSICSEIDRSESDVGARLLISKQVLNKYIVQDMDLVIKYSLYNIGNQAAANVVLTDSSFNPEVFDVVGGQLNVKFARIPPSSNASHVVVLRPTKVGSYNFTSAETTYRASDEATDNIRVSVSSEPGEGYIIAFKDFDKKFSPHLLDWVAFAVMSLPSLAIPFLLWWSSKNKYENISVKSKRN